MIQDQILRESDSRFPLWALVRSQDAAGNLKSTSETFYNKTAHQEGLLLFPSVLDAEIYCQRLRAAGAKGWHRQRLEEINLADIIEQVPGGRLGLMLAVGFYASDTHQLLVDKDRNFFTPILPVTFKTAHLPTVGPARLVFDSKLPEFIRNLWNTLGPCTYAEQIESMKDWSDCELTECATDALEKASIVEVDQYQQAWQSDHDGDECAIFIPSTREWRFGSLEERQHRSVH